MAKYSSRFHVISSVSSRARFLGTKHPRWRSALLHAFLWWITSRRIKPQPVAGRAISRRHDDIRPPLALLPRDAERHRLRIRRTALQRVRHLELQPQILHVPSAAWRIRLAQA